MERCRRSKYSFVGSLRANAKTILIVSLMSVAVLVGFYAGTLYASTWLTLENGLEWDGLVTEANYVIFVGDKGRVYAKNGFSGKIDYNNTSASRVINRAIEALPPTGGYIFIKQGTYAINETIKVPSNVALVGAGFSSKLVLAIVSLPFACIIENSARGNKNILIASLHLDGNKAEILRARGGIYFKEVCSSTIQNCWIHDFHGTGLHLRDGGGNVVRNNFVHSNRNAGIEGTNEDHDIVASNVVYSNAGDPYGYGIDYCTGSRYNIFEGNVCYNNGLTSGGGLALWDGYENTITSNTLTSNRAGITIGIPSFGNKTYGNMIIGNMISNNTADGLHIQGENNLVSENTFRFNGRNGVYINGSDTKNTIIEANLVENNQGWQIHVTTFPSDTIVKNNFIFGNYLIKNQGSNTLIKWNSGYDTENGGTAVIVAGRTSVSFEHELLFTPTHVNLTPKDNLDGRSYWYTTNSTHITLSISSPDAMIDHSFDWSAEA